MLQNAYFLAKIGADTAENEQHFAEILPTDGELPFVEGGSEASGATALSAPAGVGLGLGAGARAQASRRGGGADLATRGANEKKMN